MTVDRPTIHEVDFCGQVASTVNALFAGNPNTIPFQEARLEGFGAGTGRLKRKDLRFFDRNGRLLLCGEVKLPGTRDGRSPYDAKLSKDAADKAENAGIRYFFTWNVNLFVLWDRSLWDRPLLDRRVREWRLARTLLRPEDVAREDNLSFIKTHFLPDLLRELADIISGRRADWSMPPDDIFIRSLESHLDWPVQLTAAHILEQTNRNKIFDKRVQMWMGDQDWTFVRTPHEEWVKAVENMAKTLSYIWANRLIFYKALRGRFPDLPRLELRASLKNPDDAISALNRFFQRAVKSSGDYEPLLMPEAKDWATGLVFQPDNAIDAWRGLLRGIESVDFREVPSDVVGRIFQKLIGPEERHRYGQHFTGDDAVDLINVFCVRGSGDLTLDPACGSGSFLVRAYYRKRHLDPSRAHMDLISELFGCDISLYPAHLATLNLAAREINDEANYPRIARRNFFDFSTSQPFCHIPDNTGGLKAVHLPVIDAVVGNPPYVRQEKIEKVDKSRFGEIASTAWPGLRLTGRSDLHCYFWPAAARLLKGTGYFGFLTSSSWLDVEYGFALQGWVLRHFRILAIMESVSEPWFEDARVKTCVTILQRCDDESERMDNLVRFVRFNRKLAEIIAVPATPENEDIRQAALERLRAHILNADSGCHDEQLRIVVKSQRELWDDGVQAGRILGSVQENESDDKSQQAQTDPPPPKSGNSMFGARFETYHAGKWGRYLRAPDLYFEIMRRFGSKFVALGEVATIRRGITSGCDAFFMPKDITSKALETDKIDRAFRQHTSGAHRRDVETGRLKIVQAGDGSVHPIETQYLAPELHSPMEVDRPIVRASDLQRVVLLVGAPMDKLKTKSPWVHRYLRYGMTASFTSSKSKPVPLPKRSTCAARDPWYDLTGLVRPSIAFWPMAQQYRHIIPGNPERLVCNHNLFDLAPNNLSTSECEATAAILNSTLVGLFKTFYGRFAGTEGNLKTEVVDVNLLEVPDPRGVSENVADRLANALRSIGSRKVGRLVEEQLMDCHTPERARRIASGPLVFSEELHQPDRRALDDAVFELLGVSDMQERDNLVTRLYEATAQHFRDIRVVEIEKAQQRAKSDTRRFSVHDLAADIWDAAEIEDTTPLTEWVAQWPEADSLVILPEDRPALPSNNPLFAPNTVYFGKSRKVNIDCQSGEQADLVVRLANLGITRDVRLPSNSKECVKLLDHINVRLEKSNARFKELTESRTGDDRVREQVIELLQRWIVLGRDIPKGAVSTEVVFDELETDGEAKNKA